jgi:hypothetical protein
MANNFSKEERVAFEDILEGFHDSLVLSRNVAKYTTSDESMERSNNTVWRPMPYIAASQDSEVGTAVTYKQNTQLSVPSNLGFKKTVPWTMTALELRDALQENRLGVAARQRLASDINVAVMNVAAAQGTLVVPVATAAGDYDDVALADSIMNEQGIMTEDRYLGLSSRDYNGLAGNLAVATRSFGNQKSEKAYERNFVGQVAGFETYKFGYANRITAAAGGAITVATNGAQVKFVPRATSESVGGKINVDNRYQTITVSDSAGVKAGDCFSVDGLEAVHHITKQPTGQLKTFRVIAVPVGGTSLVISPPMIGATGVVVDAEVQYKNIEVVTPSATAAINWLNSAASNINVFWHKDSIEIMPGRYSVPSDSGVAVMRATTEQGIELVMQKFQDIDTMVTKYRMDCIFGVTNVQPQMSGILLFNQAGVA